MNQAVFPSNQVGIARALIRADNGLCSQRDTTATAPVWCSQGGPHNNTIAAVAVALKQVASPEFKQYAAQVCSAERTVGVKAHCTPICTALCFLPSPPSRFAPTPAR